MLQRLEFGTVSAFGLATGIGVLVGPTLSDGNHC